MPNRLSLREVLRILHEEGFVFVSQKGSHVKYRKIQSGETITVIVPAGGKEIPTGTVYSIIRQSKIPKEKFLNP